MTSKYSSRAELLEEFLGEYQQLHSDIRNNLSFKAYAQFAIVHDTNKWVIKALDDIKSETDDVRRAVLAVEEAVRETE